MKKLLLILALPFLFSSCNKENIEPNPPANGVELTEVKLIISSDAPTLYASISYYDETGTQKNGSLANGAIVNIDATQPIYISASCGFTLYVQQPQQQKVITFFI